MKKLCSLMTLCLCTCGLGVCVFSFLQRIQGGAGMYRGYLEADDGMEFDSTDLTHLKQSYRQGRNTRNSSRNRWVQLSIFLSLGRSRRFSWIKGRQTVVLD